MMMNVRERGKGRKTLVLLWLLSVGEWVGSVFTSVCVCRNFVGFGVSVTSNV